MCVIRNCYLSGLEELGTRSNGQCCPWDWKVTTIGPKHIPDSMPGIEQLLWPRLQRQADEPFCWTQSPLSDGMVMGCAFPAAMAAGARSGTGGAQAWLKA